MCKLCQSPAVWDFSRRDVLLSVTGAGVAAGLLNSAARAAADQATTTMPESDLLDVRVVYMRPPGKYWLGWPGTFWDPEGFVVKSRGLVEQFGKDLGIKVTFEPEPIHEPAAVEAFIAKVKAERPKGVVVFPLNADEFISGAVDKVAQSGVPTVIFAGLGMWHTGFAQLVVHFPASGRIHAFLSRLRTRACPLRHEDDPGGIPDPPNKGCRPSR